MRTMVLVYLPTKLGEFMLGKCWDSYSSTMVRIWAKPTSQELAGELPKKSPGPKSPEAPDRPWVGGGRPLDRPSGAATELHGAGVPGQWHLGRASQGFHWRDLR